VGGFHGDDLEHLDGRVRVASVLSRP